MSRPPTGSTSTQSLTLPTILSKPCHRRQRCSRSMTTPIPPIWNPFSPNNVFLLSSRMVGPSANRTHQSLRRHRARNVERHSKPVPPKVVQLSALSSAASWGRLDVMQLTKRSAAFPLLPPCNRYSTFRRHHTSFLDQCPRQRWRHLRRIKNERKDSRGQC